MPTVSPVAAPHAPALPRPSLTPAARVIHDDETAAIQALITGYRLNGWRVALLDPLDGRPREPSAVAELDPRSYRLALDESVAHSIELGGLTRILSLPELLSRLRASYCGTIVLDCAHLRASDQQRWLYAQLEAQSDTSMLTDDERLRILELLVAAETFEHYQRATYPRHKQFSAEGSESLIPMLDAVIEEAVHLGVEDIVLGMPHRGRLNVLKNVFNVPAKQLFSLFSGNPAAAAWDLKDHFGCSMRKRTVHGDVDLLLAHNPSHLESVCPVVCGMTRARQDRKGDGFSRKVMPILIHGDASFCAQGVVTETLNLSQTRGYGVGGTVHLILNNQIGSTVSHPGDARSTPFCSDLARAIDAPIIHVNADDPDAAVAMARLATAYRMRFGADIVVDHVGYRRHGHFGGDDPTMTQPATQRHIRSHPSVVLIYKEKLGARGLAVDDAVERLNAAAVAAMSGEQDAKESATAVTSVSTANGGSAMPAQKPVATKVPLAQLQSIVRRLTTVPPGFALHPGLRTMLEDWRAAGDGDRLVDWCLAENLAYGSLLANGFKIRLSGLDVGRGSFFHRYHVWHDQAADTDWQMHVPLRHIAETQGFFSIFESPLSEEAVVGFEYGYALQCGRDLVIWEAQFGDFVNNAQVIIDQYIASGERKWGYKCGLVLLLPHGHEGGGPEHSCAYLGRFLQLCAEGNLQVAMPSTAGQYYHLLRRQALVAERKPLIVMTPKTWLYGHQPSHSSLRDLARGEFQPVLGERREDDPAAVVRLIVASGKICHDLLSGRASANANVHASALLRLEQLYPFPAESLAAEIRRYPRLRQVVWAQEEARNHGAWPFLREALEAVLPPGVALGYAGRPAAAPTAVCNAELHAAEQRAVVASALGLPPS